MWVGNELSRRLIIRTSINQDRLQTMTTKSIPELLRRSLESHISQADLHDDEETQQILAKLSVLSAKVAEAKAKALARRAEGKKG